jgi:hypothetical protein
MISTMVRLKLDFYASKRLTAGDCFGRLTTDQSTVLDTFDSISSIPDAYFYVLRLNSLLVAARLDQFV